MGEQQLDVVHDFVDEEVLDGEVAEVVVVWDGLLLVEHQKVGYFSLVEIVYFLSFFYSLLFCCWS